MNLGLIFGVLEQSLKLWNSKESSKYLDQVIKLKKRWYEEYNKPENKRSDVALDAIELHLSIICKAFIDTASVTDTKN